MNPSQAGERKHPEMQYLDLLQHVLSNGERKIDRTKVGTLSVFGATVRFDLSGDVMPILTTKRIYWKTAAKEMLWFLTGGTNIQPLVRANCGIWTDWPLKKYREETGEEISQEDFEARIAGDDDFASVWGELGPVYGKQWRRWLGPDGREHDQIADLIETLRNNPSSRRMLFHGWNVGELEEMALPPCHLLYQFYVSDGGERGIDGLDIESFRNGADASSDRPKRLSCLIFQRSCDLGLGVGWNFFNAALLTRMLAQQTGMEPGELIWVGGDTHLYLNHIEMAQEQISREPRPWPTMKILRKPESIDGYRIEDFVVEGYDPHPAIKADVAV
ncbi:thymidylate synthase [Agrobacterium rubi]|nr:thymidylate synthase [Agrobacterium rubi]NTF24357.1 thymidylate synthase [Agrobacterium rubi]